MFDFDYLIIDTDTDNDSSNIKNTFLKKILNTYLKIIMIVFIIISIVLLIPLSVRFGLAIKNENENENEKTLEILDNESMYSNYNFNNITATFDELDKTNGDNDNDIVKLYSWILEHDKKRGYFKYDDKVNLPFKSLCEIKIQEKDSVNFNKLTTEDLKVKDSTIYINKNKNNSTDILSFPFNKKIKYSKNMYLGDIIISYNYLNKPKSQDLELFKQKTIRIFIHGFLHLLGFDHKKNKDYSKMLKEENLIFKSVQSKIN